MYGLDASRIEIVAWHDVEPRFDPGLISQIDRIFFSASATQSFASEQAKATFRERWLGRYLVHDRDHVWLARAPSGEVVGYLVGSLDDPSVTPRFGDIAYFATFAAMTARYPAHLHVNLDEKARDGGVGGLLVEAFAAQVKRAGLPGVHVVTSRAQRNVRFYNRLGFIERASLDVQGRDIVLLGRDLW